VHIPPNPKLLLHAVKLLATLAREIHHTRKKFQRTINVPTDGQIDTDILTKEQQDRIDTARRKNQEAIEDALRNTRPDGLPRAKPGYNWKPSHAGATEGILVPAVRAPAKRQEDLADPERERSAEELETAS